MAYVVHEVKRINAGILDQGLATYYMVSHESQIRCLCDAVFVTGPYLYSDYVVSLRSHAESHTVPEHATRVPHVSRMS